MVSVSPSIRFMLRRRDADSSDVVGPLDVDTLRAMFDAASLRRDDPLCREGRDFWAPAVAWEALGLDTAPPPRHTPERLDMPERLTALSDDERGDLRWWLRDGGRAFGPMSGRDLQAQLGERTRAAMISLAGDACWFPRSAWEDAQVSSWRAEALSAGALIQCGVCLEEVPADNRNCPECGELLAPCSQPGALSRPASIPDDPPDASWIRMHWRPFVTMGAIFSVIASGIALRHLAPDRYRPPERTMNPAAATEAACDTPCWHGESCQMGRCVWQPANDVGHLEASPSIAGPFELPKDMVDVLPLDSDRYAVSYLKGVQISNARTGGVLSLISDAPLAQQLYRVNEVIYASAPSRIYVIDAASTAVLKTIELGSPIADLAHGASRVLVSIPGARSVAVIATDYHAEVARFFFGDDQVRSVAIDDTGQRAMTMNGLVPMEGLKPPSQAVLHGATYSFDPSRLPSGQDRVRTGLAGNPVGAIMAPDMHTSYALLRESDAIVRLEHDKSGAVRLMGRLNTCHEPEEIALVRRGRRAVVRCDTGRAVEVFDLLQNTLIRTVPVNARISDMAITPDGRQAILALPRDGAGYIGVLDLDEYSLERFEVNAEPHRVRIAKDGRTAVVVSDYAKVAWVVR